ncbi:unnamed protein product [Dovyalis caffra]|uniref:Uncharacterized protein n=1 Tax=Dovyalis caffra TaxID=77055 RepID=A0AAV1RWL8_9ROSI|nr:unnamed protein product [Dovyalis caffra]
MSIVANSIGPKADMIAAGNEKLDNIAKTVDVMRSIIEVLSYVKGCISWEVKRVVHLSRPVLVF